MATLNVAVLDVNCVAANRLESVSVLLGVSVVAAWQAAMLSLRSVITVMATHYDLYWAYKNGEFATEDQLHSNRLFSYCVDSKLILEGHAVNRTFTVGRIHVVMRICRSKVPQGYSATRWWVREEISASAPLPTPFDPRFTSNASLIAVLVEHHELLGSATAKFPVNCCFRFEDAYAVQIIQQRALSFVNPTDLNTDHPKISVVGSPGVGKSTIMMLLAMQLKEQTTVLYVRRFCGEVRFWLFCERTVISGGPVQPDYFKILELLECVQGRMLSPFVILDGLKGIDFVGFPTWHILVTSGQHSAESREKSVLFSSWV